MTWWQYALIVAAAVVVAVIVGIGLVIGGELLKARDGEGGD